MKLPKKNWLEWSVFGLSLLLILGIVAILIHEEMTLNGDPPDPQMVIGAPEAHQGYFAVPVTVTNRGDETAEQVHLEIVLEMPDGGKETSEFDLPYLPRHAMRKAWVTFFHDPAKGEMKPRVLGYEKP